eukprot:3825511-Rhodomonas_salina.1
MIWEKFTLMCNVNAPLLAPADVDSSSKSGYQLEVWRPFDTSRQLQRISAIQSGHKKMARTQRLRMGGSPSGFLSKSTCSGSSQG